MEKTWESCLTPEILSESRISFWFLLWGWISIELQNLKVQRDLHWSLKIFFNPNGNPLNFLIDSWVLLMLGSRLLWCWAALSVSELLFRVLMSWISVLCSCGLSICFLEILYNTSLSFTFSFKYWRHFRYLLQYLKCFRGFYQKELRGMKYSWHPLTI